MFKVDLEKAEEPDQIANICWIIEKATESQKNIYFCFIDYAKAFVWITTNCGKFLKRWDQSWVFIGRTDVEAETPILWPPDSKSWLIRKDPDAGIDWRQEEKGMTEDEIVGWHHLLNRHEFEQALSVGDGHGSLACCSPWGHKELDMTEGLNWTDAQASALEFLTDK